MGTITVPEAQERVALRPMEEAPRDGSEILLKVERRAGAPGCFLIGHWMPGGHCIEDHPPIDQGWYFWNGCMFDKAAEPISWAPLSASGSLDLSTRPTVGEARPMTAGEVAVVDDALIASVEMVYGPNEVTEAAQERFAAWFRKNYPGPDTIIHKPDWHAPRILEAAARALEAWEGGE